MIRTILVVLIRAYQVALAPLKAFLPIGQTACCRFHPSCSEYCLEAVQRHGVVYGLWLGLKRILRCQPFSEGGFDPVPSSRDAYPRSCNLASRIATGSRDRHWAGFKAGGARG